MIMQMSARPDIRSACLVEGQTAKTLTFTITHELYFSI